jgi:hypothetical protein
VFGLSLPSYYLFFAGAMISEQISADVVQRIGKQSIF